MVATFSFFKMLKEETDTDDDIFEKSAFYPNQNPYGIPDEEIDNIPLPKKVPQTQNKNRNLKRQVSNLLLGQNVLSNKIQLESESSEPEMLPIQKPTLGQDPIHLLRDQSEERTNINAQNRWSPPKK